MTGSVLFSILSGLISIIRSIVIYMEQQKWIDEGRAQVIKEQTDVLNDHVAKANAAREQVRSDSARDPSSIMRPDQDQRPE